jgi:hypothetical protein
MSLIDRTQANKDSNRIVKVAIKIKFRVLVQATPPGT